MGAEAIAGAINQVILSPSFPTTADILVAVAEDLLISRDGGDSWSDWQPGHSFSQGIASVLAPEGLDTGAPVLVGLVEGGIERA
jgi:hypothetical protein